MDAENDWNDPRNKFPAILFRLSHRTDDEFRSGYRKGDSEQTVVNSMRGWWEIDSDDVLAMSDSKALNVRHAVAFHRGRARAVVRIDGWRWAAGLVGDAHHRVDVDQVEYRDHTGSVKFGRLQDDGWRDNSNVRWAFDAKPALPEARDAWLSSDSSRIFKQRRETLVSVWPCSLADDQRKLVERALLTLAVELRCHLTSVFGDPTVAAWRQNFEDDKKVEWRNSDVAFSDDDPWLWLEVARKNGHQVRTSMSRRTYEYLEQLRHLRNRWAHYAFNEHVSQDEVDSLGRMQSFFNDIGSENSARGVGFIRRVLETHVGRREAGGAA
ncbi:Swt1 family HEPN domain-containing protein [Candidatus Poriferisodalis sp.]|uniref:Swt1 family HEPN domain-containing protein n=1 Tax=Candidatus Poriferisodalis sp. TaxID=3101277 RepID=UPI003AF864BA